MMVPKNIMCQLEGASGNRRPTQIDFQEINLVPDKERERIFERFYLLDK